MIPPIRPFASNSQAQALAPSQWKSYAFLLAIIIGIGGLTAGGVGVSAYCQGVKLSRIQSICMMSIGGGVGLILFIVGIVGRINNRTQNGVMNQNVPPVHPAIPPPRANPPNPIIRQTAFIQSTSQGNIRGDKFFGKEEWAAYFGDVEEVPALPDGINQILNAQCPFSGDVGIKVKDTHMLVLIPRTVNKNPYTLNHLEKLMKCPKKGFPSQYSYYGNYTKGAYGDLHVEHAYWILMPKAVIPGSTNKWYEEQEKFIKKYPQYSVPKALEVATCVAVEQVVSSHHLLKETHTNCLEKCAGCRVHLGDYDNNGLMIGGSGNYQEDRCGMIPVRRLA